MKKSEKQLDSEKENSEITEEENRKNNPSTPKSEDLDLISSIVDDFNEMNEFKKPTHEKIVDLLINQSPGEKIEEKAQEYLEKQKDYGAYELVRTEYPLFLQLPNACGLSSILMLIDPTQNEPIRKLLDLVWNHYKKTTVLEQSRKEFQWAYALDYLLLKSAVPNTLSEYIKSLDVEELDHYYTGLKSVLRFKQQEHVKLQDDFIVNAYEEYFAHGLISQFIVTEHTELFKHNPEIQILMAIFGYEFVKQSAPDGTGALFFTIEELKNMESSSAKKKINVLRSEFIKGARIVVGFSFHWVILTNIFTSNGKTHISINDPSGEKYDIPLVTLTDRDRFYIYRRLKNGPKQLWNQIIKIIEKDGPREITLGEDFLKTVKERLVIEKNRTPDGKIDVKIQVIPEEKRISLPEQLKPIPVKVHEETVQSIKESKKLVEIKASKSEKVVKKDEKEKETSSKEAFEKKMRDIIGDQFEEYEEK
jgi:hypothetical protein